MTPLILDTLQTANDSLKIVAHVIQESPDSQTFGISNSLQTIAIWGVIVAAMYGIIKGIHYIWYHISHYKKNKNDEYTASFNTIIAQLSSNNPSSQLSAAILLRRFFDDNCKNGRKSLKYETINEISSLLRVLPTGIFQKTLGDGLAYALDLSCADLQRTNMQDIYLGNKHSVINMTGADLFMSDLSYALFDNVNAQNAQFYNAILFNTQIKNCDMTGANFMNADLNRVRFVNTILKDACFDKAYNIPDVIQSKLIDGKYADGKPVSISPSKNGKSVFFSMPGCMAKEDELLTKDYKRCLENMGYTVIYYQKDDYPKFGQLNKVKHSIESADAMVAFGLRQINICNGSYRTNTPSEEPINDKWLPTPWNEIEVGMGLMAGLPILLVKDSEIDSGVFDTNLSECFVASIETSQDSRKIETNKSFISWLSKF